MQTIPNTPSHPTTPAPASAALAWPQPSRALLLGDAVRTMVGGYGAELAASTRLRQEWTTALGAPDEIQGDDRLRIVAFSRRLHEQSPVARAVIEAMLTTVVGEGIYPQGETTEAEAAAAAFWQWADTQMGADITRRDGFGGLQSLWLREMLLGGDVLINRVTIDDHPMGIATQTIASERIAGGPGGTYSAPVSPSGFGPRGPNGSGNATAKNRIIDGVEMDEFGRIRTFYVSPYAFIGMRTSVLGAMGTPVDAAAATLLAHRTRAGQTRGLPYLAPAMARLAGLEEYTGAVEVSAKLHAMVALVTKTTSPDGFMRQLEVGTTTTGQTESATGGSGGGALGGSGSTYDRTLLGAEPGILFSLGVGEEAQSLNPGQPGPQHEAFVRTTIMQVCAVLGIPVEVAMGDFSRANFSVARMALLVAEKTAAPMIDRMARTLLHPLYVWWLGHAIAKGTVQGDITELSRVRWRGPKRLVVDPQKESAATAAAISANLTTYGEELDALGKRRDDVFAARAEEVRLMREMGITPPAPAGSAPPPPVEQGAPGAGPAEE